MKIVVTGTRGQLGFDVLRELDLRGYKEVRGIDKDDVDITNETDVNNFFKKIKPNIIIHCAAYTAVDKAEDDSKKCYDVNVNGTKYLLKQAKKYNSKFLYISTDYVFDGEKIGKYKINDLPNPKSIYGKSKYLGEVEVRKYEKHFILRTSWVFGKNGNNFVKTMLNLGKTKESLNVINDQYGSPTYTFDLSRLIVDMVETSKFGIYHGTNEGNCTWYEFSKEIFLLSNNKININKISSNEYNTRAPRPKNSILDKKCLDENDLEKLPNWKNALKRYLKEIEVIE